MTEVTTILGSPGTGKTQTCIEMAKEEIERGIDPERIAYLSFTKAAAQEAKDRISNELGIPEYELGKNWRNVHSMCFRLLSLSRSDVATSYKREKFCDHLEVDYQLNVSDYDTSELGKGEQSYGNRVFSAYDWLSARNEQIKEPDPALEKMFNFKRDREAERIDPYKVMRLWDAYKKRNSYLDFSDMLTGILRLNRIPDADIMIWDEFQDTSPLEYKVYEMWRDEMDKVYIAGDPAQAIYSFRAASPQFLMNESSQDRIKLDLTYRVPENIWQEAQEIANQMKDVEYFEVTPKRDGGEFSIKREETGMSELGGKMMDTLYGDAMQMKKEIREGFKGMDLLAEVDTAIKDDRSVMAIFRTRLCALDFQNRLMKLGFPHKLLRENPRTEIWTRQLTNLRNGIRERWMGKDVRGVKKRAMNELLDDEIWKIPIDDVPDEAVKMVKEKSQMERDPDDRTLVAKKYPLNYFQAKGLIENVNNGKMGLDPNGVKIGTKHTSKGKEADVVITSFDTSWKIAQESYHPKGGRLLTDEERRVDFVTLTRAREKMVIQESAWDTVPSHTLKALKGVRE